MNGLLRKTYLLQIGIKVSLLEWYAQQSVANRLKLMCFEIFNITSVESITCSEKVQTLLGTDFFVQTKIMKREKIEILQNFVASIAYPKLFL